MRIVKITRTWDEFIQYVEKLESDDPKRRGADMAIRAYKGEVTYRVAAMAARTGFRFEENVKEFSERELRWIEIFNELEYLDYEHRMLVSDDEANADMFGAIAGLYADDGSIARRLAEIEKKRDALMEERETLADVEKELYPAPKAHGLPRLKVWLEPVPSTSIGI